MKFTNRVKKVMELAEKVAEEKGHEYLGVEHLLLAILQEGTSLSSLILRGLRFYMEIVVGVRRPPLTTLNPKIVYDCEDIRELLIDYYKITDEEWEEFVKHTVSEDGDVIYMTDDYVLPTTIERKLKELFGESIYINLH